MSKNIIILLFLFSSFFSFAQESEVKQSQSTPLKLHNNSIYGNISFGGVLGQAGLTYERQLLEARMGYVYARAGIGFGYEWSDTYTSCRMDLAYVFFKKRSHLEVNLGMNYITDCYSSTGSYCFSGGEIKPLVNIGYRYQKPGGRFIFRLMVGTESYYNLSFGVAF